MVILFDSGALQKNSIWLISIKKYYFHRKKAFITTPKTDAKSCCSHVNPAFLSPHRQSVAVCQQILLSHWLQHLFILASEVRFGFTYNLSNPRTAVKPSAPLHISHSKSSLDNAAYVLIIAWNYTSLIFS